MFKYRDEETAKKILDRIRDMNMNAKFMHICGTHQDTVVRFGLEEMLKDVGIEIAQGPGCPVCVTTSQEIAEALKELCAELKERGQTFSFETGEELPLTLSIMMSEIGLDNVGVNFDPANLISGGRSTNPCDAMELLGCRVTGFHAKDAIPAKFGELGGRQVPIGEGKVDFKRLLAQLKELGYEGDVVIEHEMYSRPDRDGDILKAKVFLEDLIKEL